jgi:hypothetical protein
MGVFARFDWEPRPILVLYVNPGKDDATGMSSVIIENYSIHFAIPGE